jgi:hypothetical protein
MRSIFATLAKGTLPPLGRPRRSAAKSAGEARRLSGPRRTTGTRLTLLDHRPDIAAFEQRLQVVLDGIDIQPEAAGGQPVNGNPEILNAVIRRV